nr:DUF3289 family protein [Brenneria sp. CFCC 11842]
MRCGDMSEYQLKTFFGLTDVSTQANPYALTKLPQPITFVSPYMAVKKSLEKSVHVSCLMSFVLCRLSLSLCMGLIATLSSR